MVLALVLTTAGPAAAQAPAVPPAVAPPLRGVEITGATAVEFDQTRRVWTFRGSPVLVRRDAMTLRAPLIRYVMDARRLDASNGVEFAAESLAGRAPGVAAFLAESRVVTNGRTQVVATSGGRETRIEADRVQVWWQEHRALATGAVVILRVGARITADRLELDQAAESAVASGSVVVEQEDATLRAARVELDQRRDSVVATGAPVVDTQGATITAPHLAAQLSLGEVVATGGVRVTRGDVVAEAPEGRYDRVGHVLLLTGGATVRRAGDVLTAATVRITFLSGGGMTLVAEGNPQVVGAVEDAP